MNLTADKSLALLGMALAGLLILCIACSEKPYKAEPDPFVLGDNDYRLDCNSTGNDEKAWACQLAYLTNRERKNHPQESDGADFLDWDQGLAEVGETYSTRMCEKGFFDHDDPRGNGIEVRLLEAGITYVKAGENLAQGTDLYPSEVMRLFMDEPSCRFNHRSNILDNDFAHIGVGVFSCEQKIIYTQLLATFHTEDLRDDPNEFCNE